MIYKITLTLSGIKFIPEQILNLIKGEYFIAGQNNPSDKKFIDSEEVYGFGSISFFHPKKFSLDNYLNEYEEWYINFLLVNYNIFNKYGVDNIQLFIEIYHKDEQCNFEIFDKNLIKKMSHISISIPVSIYLLKKEEFEHWVKEIDTEWNGSAP